MSCRDKVAANHQPDLPVKMLLLLVFCLAGISAHFLADSFEHFLWQPVSEVSSLQADHVDHQEQFPPANRSTPAECPASVQRALLQDSLFRIFPPITPLPEPPKYA
jgi:hypothetical protein